MKFKDWYSGASLKNSLFIYLAYECIKVIWLLMSDDLSLYIFSELKLNAKVKTEKFSAAKGKFF